MAKPEKENIPYSKNELEVIYSDSLLLSYAMFDRMIEADFNTATRNDIVNQINNLDFDTSPENFYYSLEKATDKKQDVHFSKRSLASLKEMKTYKIRDVNAGFALCNKEGCASFSKIIAVHNGTENPNIGVSFIGAANRLGGFYIDCFGDQLSNVLNKVCGYKAYNKFPDIEMENGLFDSLYLIKWRESITPLKHETKE